MHVQLYLTNKNIKQILKTYMHNTHKFLLIAKQCMEVIVWRRKLREIKEDTAQAQNDHICIKLEFTRSYCEMVLWRLSKLADIVDVFFICMDNYELATCVVFRSKLMVIAVWNENTQTDMLSWWHSSKKKTPATKLIQCRSLTFNKIHFSIQNFPKTLITW